MYKVYIFDKPMEINLLVASLDDQAQAINFASMLYHYSALPVRVMLNNRDEEFPLVSFWSKD